MHKTLDIVVYFGEINKGDTWPVKTKNLTQLKSQD